MVTNLEAAARIQRSLLPEKEQRFKGISFSSLVQPCDELGGDALNVVPIKGNRYAVYTVDVSGHGVRASLLSVTLSHWFSRVLSGPKGRGFEFTPVEVAEELNRQFKMDSDNPQYFTMCFGIVDIDEGKFSYVTAGAPPVIVVRGNSETEVLEIEGFPVGLVEEPGYTETVVELSPSDRVFLYTDGVIEAEDQAEEGYGTKRLAAELLKRGSLELSETIDAVLQSVSSWEATSGHRDDCSILAFVLAE
jgi:sigma-B regulation protein RsbU (phosphoserine phosphatase)